MKNILRWAGIAIASAAIALAGCSSGSSDDPAGPVAPAEVTFSGTAATGAAFVGAVITVLDSRGELVGTSDPVGDDGAYTVTLDAGAVAPFIIIASRTNADGQVDSMVSVADSAESTTLNVTPVTTLIASLLSPSGDPLKLSEELKAGTAQISAASVSATVAEVKQILAPILAATGTSDFNPLNSSFATDGTGFDRLLDSISISIIPASETSSNIEIGVKTTDSGEGTPPPVIQFKSDDSVANVLTANNITSTSVGGSSVTTANLVESGTSVLISNFLQELTSCYAVPFANRVSGVSGTMTAVVGTASAVIAPECRNVFHDNDPATFKSNGGVVQRTANNTGAFASLFRAGATGVVFSQGRYEFTRSNPERDMVISYKSRDTSGGENFDTLVVRKGTDGKLRLIGNQYQYPGSVSAYHQLRNFITLDQSEYNYISSGYTLHIDNLQDEFNPRFKKVEVTTPTGSTLTLYPSPGSSFLVFYKSMVATSTNFVRLGSAFVDTSMTASPSTIDTTSLFFASPQRSEAELAAIPAQSAWTFRYFLWGNATTEPDAIQSYKTRARALTMGELRLKGMAALVPEIIADISAGASPEFGVLPLDANEPAYIETDGGGNAWTVPANALPPTSIRLFGRIGGGASFDDAVTFPSTARKAVVSCSPASMGDMHCSSTVTGGYASNVNINGLHLWARDTDGREYANFYAMYKLNIAP